MKKFITFCAVVVSAAAVCFANSYTNNTYQKLAKEYTVKAERALDAGEYDLAEEYAAKAEENAVLSDAYIAHMLAKDAADKEMAIAKARIEAVKEIKADVFFPIAYDAATKLYAQAEASYAREDYDAATLFAQQITDVLAEVHEVVPLPKYYIVRPWATDRDCFWNISGRPYVYNNPWLWENLYTVNKAALPKPENPNLILPGMKMEIPSITGEYRDGVYSPDVNYTPYSAN